MENNRLKTTKTTNKNPTVKKERNFLRHLSKENSPFCSQPTTTSTYIIITLLLLLTTAFNKSHFLNELMSMDY